MNLNILSGGAAQGLVASLAAAFKAKTGFDIRRWAPLLRVCHR